MTPDDPRHGTNAGYVTGCRCAPCADASFRYHTRLAFDHANGRYRTVEPTGTRRRIEALMRLGWTQVQIGERLGINGEAVRQIRSFGRVNVRTVKRIAAVYDDLSTRRPPERNKVERLNASRTRNRAERLGWAPPAAWDDIDDPTENPKLGEPSDDNSIDPVVVERILAGEKLPANRAEKYAVIDAWLARGGSATSLENLTGWAVWRMIRDREKDVA